MIDETFFNNLDLWTSALLNRSTAGRGSGGRVEAYGIKKLRELILELAVRGKLVVQEEDWDQICLGNLGEWAVGSGFPTSEQGREGLEILFAKVSDMNLPENSKFIITTNHTISKETANKLRVNVHSAGTVVFPKIGGAIATNKRRILSLPTAIDNNCLGITPKTGVSTDWLYLVLSVIDFTKYQAGTSVPALSQGVLAKIQTMLPSLAEQHRIVAKVDELMSLCDQLEQQQTTASEAHQTLVETLLGTLTNTPVRPEPVEGHASTVHPSTSSGRTDFTESWTRIANHFDTLFTTEQSIDLLKQTILKLAVMGKLVPQDPNDEPASVLLEKIAEKKERLAETGKIKKDKPLPGWAEDETPFCLPRGWSWSKLEELVDITSGITLGRKLADKKLVTLPYLRVANVQRGYLELDVMKEIELPEGELEKYSVLDGDLLITEGGDWDKVGRTAIWRSEISTVVHQNHIFKARRFLETQNIKWLEKFLNSEMAREYFAGSSKQTTNLASINKTQLRRCPIAVPPLAEQHRIVTKVNELMTLCDTLKARLAAAQTTQLHLADTIVEQAVSSSWT